MCCHSSMSISLRAQVEPVGARRVSGVAKWLEDGRPAFLMCPQKLIRSGAVVYAL